MKVKSLEKKSSVFFGGVVSLIYTFVYMYTYIYICIHVFFDPAGNWEYAIAPMTWKFHS